MKGIMYGWIQKKASFRAAKLKTMCTNSENECESRHLRWKCVKSDGAVQSLGIEL